MEYKRHRKQAKAIDETWFERFADAQAKVGETYTALEPLPETVTRERHLFESSQCKRLPNLRPDRLNSSLLSEAMASLYRLQNEVRQNEPNEHVRVAYVSAINQLMANIRLILAAHNGDYSAFAFENTLLYGDPDETVFAAVCAWIRHDLSTAQGGGVLASLAADALAHIPDTGNDWSSLVPSELVFRKVRDMHRRPGGFYDYIFGQDGLPADAYITQEQGDSICRQMLRNIGSDYDVVSSGNNIWSTSRDQRVLLRPDGYRLNRDEFTGIVSHEIGSHILEVANGSLQSLRLLSMGLDGYEKSNEGRAFLREQIVYTHESVFLRQFAWEYIVLLYLSVGLAHGLGGKPFTFVELYEAVRALYAFWRHKRYPLETNNEEFAKEEAWHLAVRIYKGTPGDTAVYRKDTVYLTGNVACWKIAEDNPEMILLGDIGKIDISNKLHLEILTKLGII